MYIWQQIVWPLTVIGVIIFGFSAIKYISTSDKYYWNVTLYSGMLCVFSFILHGLF